MAYENIIIIVIVIAAIVIGAKKIPELARTMGKAKSEFEKGSIEGDREVKDFKDKESLR